MTKACNATASGLNDAPERIWAEGGETSREAVDSLIVRLRVAYGGELSRDCAATLRALIARAEQDQAEKEAAVAAAYEDAAHTAFDWIMEAADRADTPEAKDTLEDVADDCLDIRARADTVEASASHTDPLEAAKAEVRAEALDAAHKYLCDQYGISPLGHPIDRKRILTLISTNQKEK